MALVNGDERASLGAAQAGSSSDFETLFRLHWPRAHRVAYLILLDHAAAEGVTEEAFLAAVRTLDGFDGERPFSPWLHRMVVNRAVDRARARAARAEAVGADPSALEATAPIGWEIPLGGPHTDPGVRAVAVGLASMTPEERAVVCLRLMLDYTPPQVADMLEAPRATTAERYRQGIDRLRAGLDGATDPKESELRTLLLAQPVPGEHLAQDRTWDVVQPAFLARERRPTRRRWPWKTLTVLALVAVGLGIAFSPAGSDIGGWIRDKLGRDRVVTAVPAPLRVTLPEGRLLVVAGGRAFVVQANGARTALGRWEGGAWAPSGRFVAVWRRGVLAGLDPADPRVTLWEVEGRSIAGARWSSDDLRVAYLSRRSLRVVGGNGSDARRLARNVVRVAPEWRPGSEHVLAYADRDGRVVLLDADARRPIWRRLVGEGIVALDWASADRLAVLSRDALRILDDRGRIVERVSLGGDVAPTALDARPGEGGDVAYAVLSRTSGIGSVFLLDGRTDGSRLLFAGAGRLDHLLFSPSGRQLLVAWPAGDEWLFLPPGGSEVVGVVPAVSRSGLARGQPTLPVPAAWCCSPAGG